MNKYQFSLIKLRLSEHYRKGNEVDYFKGDELDLLQELVDKETPMKPFYVGNMILCGNCKRNTIYKIINNEKLYRCNSECGQVVDWSDE